MQVDVSAMMPLLSSVSMPAMKIGISPSASSRHNSTTAKVARPSLPVFARALLASSISVGGKFYSRHARMILPCICTSA